MISVLHGDYLEVLAEMEPESFIGVMERQPAEVFPPGEFIADELVARGWTVPQLARRMGGDATINHLKLARLMLAPAKGLLLDHDTAEGLARAFGTSADYWRNLDATWQSGSA